jgi:hypothetical protein
MCCVSRALSHSFFKVPSISSPFQVPQWAPVQRDANLQSLPLHILQSPQTSSRFPSERDAVFPKLCFKYLKSSSYPPPQFFQMDPMGEMAITRAFFYIYVPGKWSPFQVTQHGCNWWSYHMCVASCWPSKKGSMSDNCLRERCPLGLKPFYILCTIAGQNIDSNYFLGWVHTCNFNEIMLEHCKWITRYWVRSWSFIRCLTA